jgi:hypothetical protein
MTLYNDPRSRKKFKSPPDFLYKFLSNSTAVRENPAISSKLSSIRSADEKVADSLEFLWPLLMTLENISPSVMENIVSNMSYVTSSYKELLGMQPEKDSAVEFNEAVNVYLTGEYGKFLIRQKTNYQRAQSSWWTNYIVKLSYRRLFNENLDEAERTNRKILKNMQVWFDREKLKNPHSYVLKKIVENLIEHGSIKRIGLMRPVYSGKNEYKNRILRLNRYINRLDSEIALLKSENRYSADLEKISAKAKEDLAEIEKSPSELTKKAIEAERLLLFYRQVHNRDSLFLTAMIAAGMIGTILLSRLILLVKIMLSGIVRRLHPLES